MKNLSIYFDTFNPGWPMEIRILGGRVMNPIFDGQVHRYELSPGPDTERRFCVGDSSFCLLFS